MKFCRVLFLVVILAAFGTVRGASRAGRRAECDPWALRPCVPVILQGEPLSRACCAELRKQRRCLCKYAKNPYLGRYINSQNCKKVAATCRFRAPRCY